jgi:hypothetical protein
LFLCSMVMLGCVCSLPLCSIVWCGGRLRRADALQQRPDVRFTTYDCRGDLALAVDDNRRWGRLYVEGASKPPVGVKDDRGGESRVLCQADRATRGDDHSRAVLAPLDGPDRWCEREAVGAAGAPEPHHDGKTAGRGKVDEIALEAGLAWGRHALTDANGCDGDCRSRWHGWTQCIGGELADGTGAIAGPGVRWRWVG